MGTGSMNGGFVSAMFGIFLFATQRGSTHRILWEHHGENPGDIVGISGICNQEYDSLRL